MGARGRCVPDRDRRHAHGLPGGARHRSARGPERRPEELRRALESEFRGKLLRLRLSLGLHGGDPVALRGAVGYSIGPIRVLLRATLVLLEHAVPGGDPELVGRSRGCSAWTAAAAGVARASSRYRVEGGSGGVRGGTSGSSRRRPGSLTNITLEITDAFRTVFRAGHGPAPTSWHPGRLAVLTLSGCGYNTIQRKDEAVNQAASQIKVQLQRAPISSRTWSKR